MLAGRLLRKNGKQHVRWHSCPKRRAGAYSPTKKGGRSAAQLHQSDEGRHKRWYHFNSYNLQQLLAGDSGKWPISKRCIVVRFFVVGNVVRARRSRYPALPQTLHDLDNLLEIFSNTGPIIIWRVSTSNTTTEVNGSIVFAADEGLRWLANYPDWHLDGTFKVAAPLFTPAFTIHVVRDR